MKAPNVYRHCISDIESILGLSATPLNIENATAFLICHPQLPNSKPKKVAIKFIDEEGEGFDVYEYDRIVDYINIPGQYPTSLGPALIKDIETIYHDVEKMIEFTEFFHLNKKSQPSSD